MLYTPNQDSSIGSSKMVTNAELAKKVEKREELPKVNREMKGILEKLTSKLEHMKNVVKKKEMKVEEEEEEQVPDDDEDEVSKTKKPFFKALKDLGGKPIELPMFMGKMEAESVLEWIEALENHFQCEKILES